MKWLNDLVKKLPISDDVVFIESGGSPSGTYHFGHLRELIICDAILLELKKQGRKAKHVYFSDDLDALRKIPINIPTEFERYLGFPLCDVPSPDDSSKSYGEYFTKDLIEVCKNLGIEVEFIYSHIKYREGFFVAAIEKCLDRLPKVRNAIESISGSSLSENWTPIQILEDGRLKNRNYISIDKENKTIQYLDKDHEAKTAHYDKGEVKLNWRIDWPSRWWLLKVQIEPFGREHASAGGSYDTAVKIMSDVYESTPPIAVPYDSVNMTGDSKKMSASKGTGLDVISVSKLMPPEIIRYFFLRASLNKRLYFDPVNGVVKLIDEFAQLIHKSDKSEGENQLLYLCSRGLAHKTISQIPFSHLVASYQAALKDLDKTIAIIKRTEYANIANKEEKILRNELVFIDEWLINYAPEDVKFTLNEKITKDEFTNIERAYFSELSNKIENAPSNSDGAWFHQAIYEMKEISGLETQQLFSSLYRLLIGKDFGPRAGWFLSILPKDWLLKRLRFEI